MTPRVDVVIGLDIGTTSAKAVVRTATERSAPYVEQPTPWQAGRGGQTEIDPYNALCMAFAENRDKFPAEELMRYGGKVVAWWVDGSRIVDSDVDGVALVDRLRANGFDMTYVKLENIPFPGETFV